MHVNSAILAPPTMEEAMATPSCSMSLTVFGSGSSGNCSLIQAGSTKLLIDAGFSGKEIKSRLELAGIDPADLTAILVTHEHSDHIKSVHTLSRQLKIPFFSTEGTFISAFKEKKFFDWIEIRSGKSFDIGGIAIHPIALPHDAADPVGFRLEYEGSILGHMTDFGSLNGLVIESLKGCNMLLVEANHDKDMLIDGPYPWPLKQRIAGRLGHLSNDAFFELLPQILHDQVKHLVLAHLSDTNNNPRLLAAQTKQVLKRIGLTHIPFHVAQQDRPSETFQL